MKPPVTPPRRPPPNRSRSVGVEIGKPFFVSVASGLSLFFYFILFDHPGPLAVAAVLAYWTLFACTYLVLGRPGKDWLPPVDLDVLVATFVAVFRSASGRARSGLTVLSPRVGMAARGAGSAILAVVRPSSELWRALPIPRK